MKVVAIVPIKLINERLPNKNTRNLGGDPLIYYCQRELKQVVGLDAIYVYCSSNEIQSFLLPGVKLMIRDQRLDSKSTNFTQIFMSFRNEVEADIYVYAHATAPFITAATIQTELDAVVSGKYDSAFCAERIQDYLWQEGKPLNFNPENIPRSQDLPTIYRETSGAYVFRKEIFDNMKRRVGANPYVHEVTKKEAVDINTETDFRLAELFLGYPL